MPRFFFDIYDGRDCTKDDDGQVCDDLAAARREALRVLPDIARDGLGKDGDRLDIVVDVRDSTGLMVYTATISLVGRWIE